MFRDKPAADFQIEMAWLPPGEKSQIKITGRTGNRKTGQEIKLELTPQFAKENLNLSDKQLLAAGARTTALPENQIFRLIR